ncbi:MAG: hypothetical protein LBE70_01670, partial [Nitrososphaerota archaeon]|nr:hypothetical protein [Nitrososphaerota archaeon]
MNGDTDKSSTYKGSLINFFTVELVSTEGSCAYEQDITKYVKQNGRIDGFDKELYNIINEYYDEHVKYAAFYAYVINCRYNHKEQNFENIEYFFKEETFKNHKSHLHLHLEWRNRYHPTKVKWYPDVESAKKDKADNPEHAGVAYLFGSLIATVYENNNEEDETKEERKTNLDTAYDAVEKAIELAKSEREKKGYTKFYSGKSRLLYLQKKFKEALVAIDIAIKNEPHDESSTSENMRRYYDQKMKIMLAFNAEMGDKMSKIDEDMNKLQNQAKKDLRNLRKQNSKNMEFLAIFTAIITLIIGSLQFVAGQPNLDDAIKLMLVLFGVLLSAFAGFRIIFHEHEEN